MYKAGPIQIIPVSLEDASQLSKLMLANETAFKKYLPKTCAQNKTKEDSEIFIKNLQEDAKNKVQFLFSIKTEKTLVGLVYLKELDWKTKEGEFAYCMDQSHEGKGWVSAVVTTISQVAFEEHGLKVLNIIAHKSNYGSVRVAEKCGFTWKKTLLNEFTPEGGEPLDMELFQLYKSQTT